MLTASVHPVVPTSRYQQSGTKSTTLHTSFSFIVVILLIHHNTRVILFIHHNGIEVPSLLAYNISAGQHGPDGDAQSDRPLDPLDIIGIVDRKDRIR